MKKETAEKASELILIIGKLKKLIHTLSEIPVTINFRSPKLEVPSCTISEQGILMYLQDEIINSCNKEIKYLEEKLELLNDENVEDF